MIRKVYEVDPMLCPKCNASMKVVAFITDFSMVDRIINYLKLSFIRDDRRPGSVGAYSGETVYLFRFNPATDRSEATLGGHYTSLWPE